MRIQSYIIAGLISLVMWGAAADSAWHLFRAAEHARLIAHIHLKQDLSGIL